jgi:hypothetical protein
MLWFPMMLHDEQGGIWDPRQRLRQEGERLQTPRKSLAGSWLLSECHQVLSTGLVERSFAGHWIASGPFHADAQIQAFRTAKTQEMKFLAKSMNNKNDTDEDKMEELVQDLQVQVEP